MAHIKPALSFICCFLSITSALGSGPEVNGIVLDQSTGLPLAGVYVVSTYVVLRRDIAASTSWCVKTKGTLTGPDGNFQFPPEVAHEIKPYGVSAVKAGYQGASIPAMSVDRTIVLRVQDPKEPKLSYGTGEEFCKHAEYYEDAAAGIEFLKIAAREREKYGVPKASLEAGQSLIDRLEALPRRGAQKK